MVKGVGVSSGIGIGKVMKIEEVDINIDKNNILPEEIPNEIKIIDNAFDESFMQLEDVQKNSKEELHKETIEILKAHMMILKDEVLKDEIRERIKERKIKADYALNEVINEKIALFEQLDDPYLKERASDIRAIGQRILRNIKGIPYKDITNLAEDTIIVTVDMTPTQMANMDRKHVKGIIAEIGGKTCHTAILAKTLGIPTVLGVKNALDLVTEGAIIVIDGDEGSIHRDLKDGELVQYKAELEKQEKMKEKLLHLKDSETITKDGRKVEIYGNIGSPQEAKIAFENGAEGIGLFRTEFLFMDRDKIPSEEQQFEAYKEAAINMKNRPVTIRTLDIGGDKEIPYLNLPKEANPFLGYRAIRICLDRKELFKDQLRAILRASAFGKVKIMYPMISSLQEVKLANEILKESMAELDKEGIEYDKNIEVGIMIETPSAAITADHLIKEVDFFSIGTNDLTQYTLAVDRMNERISHLYNSFNPAVLRLIKKVIDISHEAEKYTAMCGEFAGNPTAVILLLGMGLDEFSMTASSILKVRNIINSVEMAKAEEVAANVLELEDSDKIEVYLNEVIDKYLK